jgi:selenocysteine lyase/cysteine desulfurase
VVASLRGSALRVSPNVYNDARDVEALLQVLREAVR